MNILNLLDFENVKENVFLGIRPHKDDGAATIDYLDLEVYMYIWMDYDSDHTLEGIINNDVIKMWDVPVDVVFNAAKANSLKKVHSFWLSNIITGADPDHNHMSLTSRDYKNGAVAMCFKNVLLEKAKEFNTSLLYIVPMSIHDVMLANPADMTIEEVNELIRDINGTTNPDEVLSDHVYILNTITGEIIF